MLTNIMFANLIKDLLSVISTAVILALFLIVITFIICTTVVIIRCIILALVTTFKGKKSDDLGLDIDYEKYNEFISTAEE